MSYKSIFEIVGPIMIGPSSSHTAGAVEIGLQMRAKLNGVLPSNIQIFLYESFSKTGKGHATDRAIIAGLLGFAKDDKRIKNAHEYARKENIEIEINETNESSPYLDNKGKPYANVAKIVAGDIILIGASIGGGAVIIKDEEEELTTSKFEPLYNNVSTLLELSAKENKSIAQIAVLQELSLGIKTKSSLNANMLENFNVMGRAIKVGINGVKSSSGLSGGDAKKMHENISKINLLGTCLNKAVTYALATAEVNASMDEKICAVPTAGACGVVPGILFALKEEFNLDTERCIEFLITAGAFGLIVANNASISGATGGCQAEVGTASAMAAAAMAITIGLTIEQSADAFSIALSNLLGLVCDPIEGLVELPCINRNAIGVSNAFAAVQMVASNITTKIHADCAIEAMNQVGNAMCSRFKETAEGGLAVTKSAKIIKEQLGLK